MSGIEDVRVIAVDWSGSASAKTQRETICVAEVVEGRLRPPEAGRTRQEVIDHLIELAGRKPSMIVGFDFAFSLPAWYLTERGLGSAIELWDLVDAESLTKRMQTLGLNRWMNAPDEPFFAKGGHPQAAEKRLRRTELEVSQPRARPKSVFQLVGGGQVGRGSLRGMQALHRLRAAGFNVWPFDQPRPPFVVEIYPALFKDDPVPAVITSPHARDAAASALAMWRSLEQLLDLEEDPDYALEGRIWKPEVSAKSVVVVRAGESSERQQIGYTVGVSAKACGSTGLSLSHIVIPPGAVADAHFHDGYETAIYQLSGRVETHFGPGLAESIVTEAGDFVFVPPGVPHQPRNLSDTEPATAIVARNDAREDERVVPYEP